MHGQYLAHAPPLLRVSPLTHPSHFGTFVEASANNAPQASRGWALAIPPLASSGGVAPSLIIGEITVDHRARSVLQTMPSKWELTWSSPSISVTRLRHRAALNALGTQLTASGSASGNGNLADLLRFLGDAHATGAA